MDKKTVLIISENAEDGQQLSSVLARAEPQRFLPLTANTREQPVAALMDSGNDAVILAYSRETEYLLRLAQKKKLSLPIIALIDQESGSVLSKLHEAGATDYILRDQFDENRLYQMLDGAAGSDEAPLPEEPAIEVQQATTQLHNPAHAQPKLEPPAATNSARAKRASGAAPLALAISSAFAAPWKVSIVATIVGLLLVSGTLFSQRLDSESRLARLEASNDFLSSQLRQLHSDLTQIALKPTNPGIVITTPGAVVSAQPLPVQAPPTPEPSWQPAAPEPMQPIQPMQPVAKADAQYPEPDRSVPITEITQASNESWFINLGTFSSHGAARRFANSLGPSSQQWEIHGVTVAGRNLFRVRVVDLPSMEVAEALALDYQITLGGGRPWVGQE